VTIVLAGERVLLRELAADDWPAVHAYATLPEVFRFQPWGPNAAEETRAYVDAIIEAGREEPRARYALAIVLKATQALIGVCELVVKSRRFGIGEIAYVLHPLHWGHGYATEAARLLLDFGFGPQSMHRIQATCDPRNAASSGVLRRLGMQYEGRLRDTMLIRDGWRDSDLYSMLEDEWRSM
jgi:ribosomal-protein-alanine N-acetyltransferase